VLRDLKRGLLELGTELWTFYGKAEDVFAKLSEQYGALDVVCLREPVSPEWTDVEGFVDVALTAKGGSLTTLWGAMSLYHEDDVPFSLKESPWSYSALAWDVGREDVWRTGAQREGGTQVRKPIPPPSGPWPLEKASSPSGAWTDALFDDDRAALAQLGFSDEEIETTLKVPHGGSRKGKGGETAAWARLKAWMDKEAEPEKNDPNFKALGSGF
jgi:deoxyribodipyrimidine photolyase